MVVAAETQTLAAAIDSTLLAQVRLTASIIETAEEAKAPVMATQKLLQALSDNMSGLVASRSDFVTAVRELNFIQSRSNLKEMAAGCPNGIMPLNGKIQSAPTMRAEENAP